VGHRIHATGDDVAAQSTGPVPKDMTGDWLSGLAGTLKRRVIGQDAAAEALADVVKSLAAGELGPGFGAKSLAIVATMPLCRLHCGGAGRVVASTGKAGPACEHCLHKLAVYVPIKYAELMHGAARHMHKAQSDNCTSPCLSVSVSARETARASPTNAQNVNAITGKAVTGHMLMRTFVSSELWQLPGSRHHTVHERVL
jgi:hypothetical protein